jgi:cytochrome P450
MATPPGSTGLPFVGEALAFLKDPFNFQLARTRKHGPVWKTKILGDTIVFFVGPKAFGFFLDPDNFTREKGSPPHMQAILHPDAVPFLDGERHRARKRLLLAAFTPEAVASYLPALEALLTRYLTAWAGQDEVRLADEVSKLAFDVANVLFAAADPLVHDDARAGDFAAMVKGMFSPPVKLPWTAYGKALKARDRLRTYIHEAVKTRGGDGTALAVLKDARGADGKGLTPADLEIELLHFFAALHAGVAGALAWMVVALHRHPAMVAKLRAEAAPLADGPLTLDALRGLDYTMAVVREVLRAFPIAPSTFIGVAKKDLELDGFHIKAGWKGAGAIWPTLQDGATFREPATFEDDRLGDAKLAALPANAFVPQGGGPPDGHRCAGIGLTDVLLPLFAARLTAGYTVELPEQDLSVGRGGLGPLPTGGLRARVKAR